MIPISEVNEIINGIIDGDKYMYIEGPCSINNGKKGFLSYIKSGKYLKYLESMSIAVHTLRDDLDKATLR